MCSLEIEVVTHLVILVGEIQHFNLGPDESVDALDGTEIHVFVVDSQKVSFLEASRYVARRKIM
jgi:hypothetical protein